MNNNSVVSKHCPLCGKEVIENKTLMTLICNDKDCGWKGEIITHSEKHKSDIANLGLFQTMIGFFSKFSSFLLIYGVMS